MPKRKAWLASILNFLIWGLGYLYIGKRRTFGVLLVIGEILLLVLVPVSAWTEADSLSLPGWILMSIAFAYDAYKSAKNEVLK